MINNVLTTPQDNVIYNEPPYTNKIKRQYLLSLAGFAFSLYNLGDQTPTVSRAEDFALSWGGKVEFLRARRLTELSRSPTGCICRTDRGYVRNVSMWPLWDDWCGWPPSTSDKPLSYCGRRMDWKWLLHCSFYDYSYRFLLRHYKSWVCRTCMPGSHHYSGTVFRNRKQ